MKDYKYYLLDKSKLPEISPEDKIFTERICKEFDLPFSEVSWLIRTLRDRTKSPSSVWDEYIMMAFQNYYEKLFAPDATIAEINIITNKGVVKIKASDSLFNYFTSPIDRIKWRNKKQKSELETRARAIEKDAVFRTTAIFFTQTKLTEDNKMIAIGMTLAYLKFNKGKPILTEEEFKDSPILARSWKNYLVDRVKPLYNKFKKDHHVSSNPL